MAKTSDSTTTQGSSHIESSAYSDTPSSYFTGLPEIVKPLKRSIQISFSKIEELLYTAPSFINAVTDGLFCRKIDGAFCRKNQE